MEAMVDSEDGLSIERVLDDVGAAVTNDRVQQAARFELDDMRRRLAEADELIAATRVLSETLAYLESLRALGERGVTGPSIDARINAAREALGLVPS